MNTVNDKLKLLSDATVHAPFFMLIVCVMLTCNYGLDVASNFCDGITLFAQSLMLVRVKTN